MLLAAGGFAQVLPKPDAKMFNVGLQSYTKRAFARNMLLVLMFVCYLFVSDMFMGSYVSRSSGVWFTVTHCTDHRVCALCRLLYWHIC